MINFLGKSIAVMGIVVPADHVGEGVIAVDLRKALVVLDEGWPVIQRDRFEVRGV
jgi:hypothetical protein